MKKKNKDWIYFFIFAGLIIAMAYYFGFVLQTEFPVYSNYVKDFNFKGIDFTAKSYADFIDYSVFDKNQNGYTKYLNLINSDNTLSIILSKSQCKMCGSPEDLSESIYSNNLKLNSSTLNSLKLEGSFSAACTAYVSSNRDCSMIKVYLKGSDGSYKKISQIEGITGKGTDKVENIEIKKSGNSFIVTDSANRYNQLFNKNNLDLDSSIEYELVFFIDERYYFASEGGESKAEINLNDIKLEKSTITEEPSCSGTSCSVNESKEQIDNTENNMEQDIENKQENPTSSELPLMQIFLSIGILVIIVILLIFIIKRRKR